MRIEYVGERRYARFERLCGQAGLVHAFATRPMDVSPRNGPGQEHRAQQRATFAEDWGLDPDALRICQQIHEPNLVVVDRTTPTGLLPRCDGAATDVPGLPLMTFSADCPLVLVYDPVRPAVGMVHASWRCTVALAVRRLVELMETAFASQPADLLAGIGPGAGPCCYEVQTDVYEAAATLTDRDRCFRRDAGRMYFDLWQANRDQLAEAGVPPEQIESANTCTLCHNDVFFSYRREGTACGHFGLLAALAPA